jgi:hypothetical protein
MEFGPTMSSCLQRVHAVEEAPRGAKMESDSLTPIGFAFLIAYVLMVGGPGGSVRTVVVPPA